MGVSSKIIEFGFLAEVFFLVDNRNISSSSITEIRGGKLFWHCILIKAH